jgi:hypothetical protein
MEKSNLDRAIFFSLGVLILGFLDTILCVMARKLIFYNLYIICASLIAIVICLFLYLKKK